MPATPSFRNGYNVQRMSANEDAMRVLHAGAGAMSYFAFGEAYAGYAAMTDFLTLRGSATKIVRVNNMVIRISETTGTLRRVYFVKRTAANTGGTSAAQTMHKLDVLNDAAGADVQLYSVIPGALGAGANIAVAPVVTTVPTAAPAIFSMGSHISAASAITLTTPVVLRGVTEFLCANWAGAALPAGFVAQWEVSWTESEY